MVSSEAQAIRDHVLSLKVWVEHWQADRHSNLVPTESSLILAKAHAESALTLLDRIEAEPSTMPTRTSPPISARA